MHLHCGDCAAAVARRSGLPGEVRVWRDSSAVGPCALDADTHRRLRAEWWGVAAAEMETAPELSADRELVLWFGPDPWEQIALVEVLTGVAAPALSIAALDAGVGLMGAADLRARFEDRREAGDLPGGDRRALAGLLRRRPRGAPRVDRAAPGEPRLPHLPAALARVLEDREHGRTARQIRALVDEGITDLAELMRRLQTLEAARHGVWYGDVVVRRLRDEHLREGISASDRCRAP